MILFDRTTWILDRLNWLHSTLTTEIDINHYINMSKQSWLSASYTTELSKFSTHVQIQISGLPFHRRTYKDQNYFKKFDRDVTTTVVHSVSSSTSLRRNGRVASPTSPTCRAHSDSPSTSLERINVSIDSQTISLISWSKKHLDHSSVATLSSKSDFFFIFLKTSSKDCRKQIFKYPLYNDPIQEKTSSPPTRQKSQSEVFVS